MKTGNITEAKQALESANKADPSQEETTVLLSSVKDEFSPEPKKYTKKGKKGKPSKKRGSGKKKVSKAKPSKKGDKGATKKPQKGSSKRKS
jgi:hypothetical protein